MKNPLVIALLLAFPLIAFGCISVYLQIRNIRQLAKRAFVPQDEMSYLKGRNRRRLICGTIMIIIGVMIAGSYLSGMEAKADAGRAAFNQNMPEDGSKPPPTPEERLFFRFWSAYWIVIVGLLGLLVLMASADAWATRKYGMKILRELRDEHKARLERDLAVYKHQKTDRFGNRFSSGGGPA